MELSIVLEVLGGIKEDELVSLETEGYMSFIDVSFVNGFITTSMAG